MRKLFIGVILIFVLVFSACSGGGSGGKDTEVDTSGYGLEVTFKIDDSNIKKGNLIYTATLKNSGLEPVYLSEENVKLSTKQIISDDGNIRDVFTEDSMVEFYEKMFPLGELNLEQDATHAATGVLKIEPSFFQGLNNEELEYSFDLNYDYKTLFSNNLELKYESGIFKMKVLDTISQAAPLQFTKINLIPNLGENMYILEYYISDNGKSSDISPATLIEDLNLYFREDYLNCRGSYETKRNLELGEISVRKGDNLILECPIRLTGKEGFTTKTFGDITYNYKMKFSGKIKLPRDGS